MTPNRRRIMLPDPLVVSAEDSTSETFIYLHRKSTIYSLVRDSFRSSSTT